ncbi:MAG: ABC transporter substrate-binding protein [Polyangiaceae bacterium]|nr:ABC transporter substrate-binding protein [Polyangiaceae bacterium]
MRINGTLRFLLALSLVALGFLGLILGVAWWIRPNMANAPRAHAPELLERVRESRRPRINAKAPPRVQLEVDYGAANASSLPWFPKGESPLVKPLVATGKLPPLLERIGPEPLVLQSKQVGEYGGVWRQTTFSDTAAFEYMERRLGQNQLVHWSPQGFPVVPHLAKSFKNNDNYTEFTFELRKGVRWSDGMPFTAEDILYWWQNEANDPVLGASALPPFMRIRGKLGKVEKLDDFTVRFSFESPNGLFLPKLATFFGLLLTESPAHYLKQFHPRLGDQALIRRTMEQKGLPSPNAVYTDAKRFQNPAHPRLWPWVYRTHSATAPYNFERNPYYFAVDQAGNQLPYVDRVQMHRRTGEAVSAAILSGEYAFSPVGGDTYTLMMSEAERHALHVIHWYRGDRSPFVIYPNLNRHVVPNTDGNETAHRTTRNKHELLNDKRFRQALSLAVQRQEIIDAEYPGLGVTAAQAAPDESSLFYEPSAFKAFASFDPNRANQLLDEIGLTERDLEGMRLFRDGTPMTFFVHFAHVNFVTLAQFVTEDWRRIGIRAIPLLQGDRLFYAEKNSLVHDFSLWTSNNEFLPIIEARSFVPIREESNFGIGFARWYQNGGLYGNPKASAAGAVVPPKDHPILKAYELYENMSEVGEPEAQAERFRSILKLAAENVWTISVATMPPYAIAVQDAFQNVPDDVVFTWDFLSPGNAYPERFFFKGATTTEESTRQIRAAVLSVTPPPNSPLPKASGVTAPAERGWLGHALGPILLGILGIFCLLLVLRHPYVGKRLLVMVPTLLVISVVVFAIIQLPPSDFLTAKTMELERQGEQANRQAIKELEDMFYLNDPQPVRYARWMGLYWFGSFDQKDSGLLQGNLGRSMDTLQRVDTIVGDRILLTVLISLGTILFTWAIAIPLGIYSAVRQYSVMDHILTFLGFLGMCVPPFLLALVLMYLSDRYLGVSVTGLMSAEQADRPWDFAKIWDLLKHVWLPIVVLGVGGTAGMIRVLRANLLDELNKPYVTAARARGVRPLALLLKYPVRLALNPFVSGIGGLFPALVSGGALVGIVLSLPIVGPLLLEALMMEDMYLAGSMLMVLSLLGVLGTLVSDLMLLWIDPRIRFQGGSR